MRRILIILAFSLLSITADAQSRMTVLSMSPSPPDKSAFLIARASADQSSPSVQHELARDYYYGLEGVPENHAEAYYWFSICRNTLRDTESFYHLEQHLEEFSDTLSAQKATEAYKEAKAMQIAWVNPALQRSCQDYVKVLGENLPANEKEKIDTRIQQWISEHPLPALPSISPEDERKAFMTWRLKQEIGPNGYDIEGIKKLIANGAQLSPIGNEKSLLEISASLGKSDLVKILYESGLNDSASVSAALNIALDKGYGDIVHVLTGNGVTLKAADLTRGLKGAMISGNMDLTNEFLKHGAQINGPQAIPAPFISKIVARKNIDMIKLYLKLGGNINADEHLAEPVLFSTARSGDEDIFDFLIKAGVNTNDRSFNDRSVFAEAAEYKNLGILKKLFAIGADSYLTPHDKNNIIDAAFASKDKQVLDYFMTKGFQLSDVQKTDLEKCPFEKKMCLDGHYVFRNPATCRFDICIPPNVSSPSSRNPRDTLNKKDKDALQVLTKGTSQEKTEMIKSIITSSGDYSPKVLNVMSGALFHKFRDDEGIFWHLASILRAYGDNTICPEKKDRWAWTADRIFLSSTFEFYKRREPEKIEAVIPAIIAWDSKTPYNYISHAMQADSHCLTPSRFPEIREWARQTFSIGLLPGPHPYGDQNNFIMDELIPNAQKGDHKAQTTLGNCYRFRSWCRPPAEETVRDDAYMAEQEKTQEGKMTKTFKPKSENKQRDREQELYWYQKAADSGYAPAVVALVNAYAAGDFGLNNNMQKAHDIAIDLFKKGSPYAFQVMPKVTRPTSVTTDISLSLNSYAWHLVAQMENIEEPKRDKNISPPYRIDMPDEDFNKAHKIANEYIKIYMPLYGSKK